MVERVIATPAAAALIDTLKAQYGTNLLFLQSGGCCDNSSPNCYLQGEVTIGPYEIHLGDIGGVPFYMTATQYEYWKHTQLIIDVMDGRGDTFSLEGGTGKAFLTRSRLYTDAEWAALQTTGLV
ncbi:MAG: DUF779 domain-containing protein [Azonexus sp.]